MGVIVSQTALAAFSVGEAVTTVADRLEAEQVTEGLDSGSWPKEAAFTGSIVAGMVGAYELTCENAYRRSAELGADYILWAAQGNFYGDEALALSRLSQIALDPFNNPYRTAVSDFYYNVKKSPDETKGYISYFDGVEPSTAVFYLANHVVSTYSVDAEDRRLWRQGLIDRLAQVDDSSMFPVMALGIATWALAKSGPLDDVLIDPSMQGAAYWNFKALTDLPDLLVSHQVPKGLPHAGSFYWQFHHEQGDPNGYTEDTIYATLGLIAASQINPNPNIEAAILAAQKALIDGISVDGTVWEHLSQEGETFYIYAGEMLQVLFESAIPGDINLDGRIDSSDFTMLADYWLVFDCCGEYTWCEGADLNRSGRVDFIDFEIMVDHWLKGVKE